MTSKEAYENIGLALKCYLPKGISKEIKEELQESWDTIAKDLEYLEVLKKIAYGVGTEEDLAVARKHYEREMKQALEKSNEGYTYIKLGEIMDRRNNNDK